VSRVWGTKLRTTGRGRTNKKNNHGTRLSFGPRGEEVRIVSRGAECKRGCCRQNNGRTANWNKNEGGERAFERQIKERNRLNRGVFRQRQKKKKKTGRKALKTLQLAPDHGDEYRGGLLECLVWTLPTKKKVNTGGKAKGVGGACEMIVLTGEAQKKSKWGGRGGNAP